MIITWSTWNDTASRVEFGPNPLVLSQTAAGRSELFVDGGKERRGQFVHSVELGGLRPNTTYCEREVVAAAGGSSGLIYVVLLLLLLPLPILPKMSQ